MSNDDSIPNWTMFGVKSACLEIHEIERKDGGTEFNASIGLFLDGGKKNDHKEMYISIFTDIIESTEDDALSHALSHIDSCVFMNFSNSYNVFYADDTMETKLIDDFPYDEATEDMFYPYVEVSKTIH